jgi:hypothetical protein
MGEPVSCAIHILVSLALYLDEGIERDRYTISHYFDNEHCELGTGEDENCPCYSSCE